MDKHTFETFQFMQGTENDAGSDQFFVVQDDGTFLLTKQIQYVTQDNNEEVKVENDPCAVFADIGPQQFYVNVDNSTELITVPDQFILPDSDNSLYTNSYLLQTDLTATPEQINPTTSTNAFKEEVIHNDEDTGNQFQKPINNCTEITLSDDQYRMLERKGWILLESNDKIFVLNSLGLHDITTNDKLVQKLRSDIADNSTNITDTGSLINNLPAPFVENEEILNHGQDTEEYFIQNSMSEQNVITNDESLINESLAIENQVNAAASAEALADHVNNKNTPNNDSQDYIIEVFKEIDTNCLKISTKLIFEDLPGKICLGRTANGKKLVAKVVKPKKPKTIYEKIVQNQKMNEANLNEAHFLGLIQQALKSYESIYNEKDVTTANSVIVQLFKVPTFKKSIVNCNVIVTKTKNDKDAKTKNFTSPSLITGKIIDDALKPFVHVPGLLHDHFLKSEKTGESALLNESKTLDELNIYHIHVIETKGKDNIVRVHVNLTRRLLSADSVVDYRSLKTEKTYACASCAAIFQTYDELKSHQEGQCMETDDNLTIDTDSMCENKEYISVLKNGKSKVYSCLQCDATFQRYSNCEKHVKTHYIAANKRKSEEGVDEQTVNENEVNKCKMCPAAFIHPSTLSKHILRHIKLKSV